MKRVIAVLFLVAAVPAAASTPKPTLQLRTTSLGRVIVDSHHRTLYMLTADGRNVSHCSAQCAMNWPPAAAPAKPTLAKGLSRSKLKVIRRSNGKRQLAYAGHPLYRYIGDSKPGDVNGEGINAFGGRWYVLNRSGTAVKSAPAASTSPSTTPAPAPAPAPSPYPYPYPY